MTNTTQHTLRELWFDSAGTSLYAVEQGRGPAVVFLHGGLADHRASRFRLGALAGSHRLITPDVRGSGRSIHAGTIDWDLLADDVVALLLHLGLRHAVVGGSSAGSAVALRLALRHPSYVAALVLVSPVYAGRTQGLTPAQRRAFDRMHEAGQRALTEGIEAILPLYQALPPPIREAAIAMARCFDPASIAATTRLLASGSQPIEHLGELAALSMPTLVVPGTDPEHPAELGERYAEVIPHAVLGDPTADVAATIAAFVRGQRIGD